MALLSLFYLPGACPNRLGRPCRPVIQNQCCHQCKVMTPWFFSSCVHGHQLKQEEGKT